MTTQTSYSERMSPPRPGTLAGNVDSARTITGICETEAGIGFGLAVSQGTLSDEGTILGGTLAGFKGVAIRDVTLRGDSGDVDNYIPPNSMGIMESGDIWVSPVEDVAAHNAVYFDGTTGRFGDTNGSGKLGPIPGAYWKTSASADGAAILSIPQGGRAA